MYKKRQGTSGIRGQLYETKLISLIHYRTKFDDDIEDYTLASNVSDIGTFDDICLRATVKVKGEYKPVAVFIQAKHREGNNVHLTLNSKPDLAKWFSSYLRISHLFKPDNKDVLFKGNFHELECFFIMYTTAKADLNTKELKSDFADKLNSWIGTGDEGLQPCHKEEDIVFLCEIIMKEQFAALAVQLAKFLSENAKDEEDDENKNNEGPIMPINDELMLMYHVILVQKVLDVSEIKRKDEEDEHRVASFQTDFFTNDDEFIILFKDKLFIEMLRKRKLRKAALNTLLSKLFTKPLDITVLSSLIGNVVIFNDKKFKLEFVSESMSEDLRRQLGKVHVLQSQVNEAIELGAKNMLKKRHFKVPAAFGNKDLTIRGKEDNVEPSVFITSVIDNLKNKLVGLIKASPTENIIVIDESIGKPFLNLNAGLAGTIGNIIVSDENPKYMKFADNGVSGDLAKRLYSEVQSEIPNLQDYKLHIKVKMFPKLTFDCDDDEDLEMLKDQVTVLAKHMGQFLCKEDDSILPMNDVMLRYHVLVALKAIDVSEIQCLNKEDEHRLASFRHEFFESDEDFVMLFKRALYKEILKIRKLDKYNIDLAAKAILTSRQFKVPAPFGNKDITTKIKKSKTERRLYHLKLKISELITKSGADKIVTLDESLGDGLLKLNGGIAGIVGNILVSEENTKLMKFTDNWKSLGDLSKRLFMKLQSGIENLHEYRFKVKVKKFPKLSFKRDEDDKNLAKDFLKKLIFFTNQADEERVEMFLKDEIENHQCLKVYNVRVTVDAVFQQYHKLIQTWWMRKEASYLTKQNEHYEDAVALIVDKPLMSIISQNYMIKIKNNIHYTFNEKALSCLKLENQPSGTIFVTESSALTVAKMMQSLKKLDYFVFNLEYILDLQAKDYKTVTIELTKTNANQLIIIVCNKINRNWIKKLKDIAKLLEKKRKIFVIKEILVRTIQSYFVQANNVVIVEKSSLIQMSEKSQKSILENAKVIFQDVELTFDSIIDEHSIGLIEGEVLNTAINNELIVLGESNSNSNYEKIKHLYIDRRVRRLSVNNLSPNTSYETEYLLTLHDIADHVAVVTAKPGMGKSTLLTHFALKMKEVNPTMWIVRINLLIHSEKFSRWHENKTNIGYLDTLKFFCEVLIEKQRRNNDCSIELEESNGVVALKSCTGDQLTVFELKMFLDFYNRKEIIFLFDGFDEICPTYTDEVLTLLTTVGKYPQKHKMLITSRPYDKVVSRLEKEFGFFYEVQCLSDMEQNVYLVNFWKANIMLRDLTKIQYDNLCSFMVFMAANFFISDHNLKIGDHHSLFFTICINFLHHLWQEINVCPEFVVKTCNKLYSNYDYEHWYSHYRGITAVFDTPLHLYLFAEYFQNRIKDESIIPNRWSLNINTYTVYDTFIETILKIRFQEKNKIDLCNPDNRNIYENVRVELLAKHKKLGAYAVFSQDDDAKMIFSGNELIEIKETINKIKEGTEKSGFIHSVANGIPNFIHMTFTEYFAVQYICDLLKTETSEDKLKSVWDFILNEVFKHYGNVRDVLCYKIKSDLRAIVNNNEQIIFDLLLEQGKGVFTYYTDEFRKYLYLNIKTSLLEAMDDELRGFMLRMFSLIGGITGIVGNLLIAENNTNLKFTDNWAALGKLSKRLFVKLQSGIKYLHEFDVKGKKFPKRLFKTDEENLAKDFLKKLMFATNQANDKGVEKILKNEIVDHQCDKADNIRVTAYTIILQYLDLIQRWWLVSQATYLLSNIIHFHRFHKFLPYDIYNSFAYFNAKIYKTENKIKFNTDQSSATIFVTESTTLTVKKIVQALKRIDHFVFDLESVLNLPANVYSNICIKLSEINKIQIIIIVCNNINRTRIERLECIAKVLENKRTIFVIKETLVETIQTYFVQPKTECSLIQMSEKSQTFILESAKVMLEDLEMCLDLIIDEHEKGEVLIKNNVNIFFSIF